MTYHRDQESITLKYDEDLTNQDVSQKVPFRERPRERNIQKPHESEKMGKQPVKNHSWKNTTSLDQSETNILPGSENSPNSGSEDINDHLGGNVNCQN